MNLSNYKNKRRRGRKITRFSELEILNIFKAFVEASKNSEFPFEWILSKKQIENSMIMFLILPIGIGHRQLIHIS